MLRAVWRALSSFGFQAVTQAPGFGLLDRGSARLPSDQWHLQPQCLRQAFCGYATQKPAQPSHDNDPPPSTLLRDYQNVPGIEKVDDVMKRLLSLEMTSWKEMLKLKKEQLMNKVMANPEDTRSLDTRIVALTVKILSYEEHIKKHRKDKAHKCCLVMSIDQRNKMLKNLWKTNYSVFEKICKELGIEYTLPPLYCRKGHRRFLAKKALCIWVFQEVQKLKKQKRVLKAAAAVKAAQKQNGHQDSETLSKAYAEALEEN